MKNESAVVEFFSKTPVIIVSSITIGEMYYGAQRSNNSEQNLKLYQEFFSFCKVLDITEKTAAQYSNIKMKLKNIGRPMPENDLWIASNATEHSLTIVTRDKHLLETDFLNTMEI